MQFSIIAFISKGLEESFGNSKHIVDSDMRLLEVTG